MQKFKDELERISALGVKLQTLSEVQTKKIVEVLGPTQVVANTVCGEDR